MSLATRNGVPSNGGREVVRYRDPFSMARELLSWDPFFAQRPASAFSPAFEVKETSDAFVLKADLPGVAD
jgi:HSP20 family molecular chaperone IbpA